ncbi:hypothetical protein PV325_004813 [Microctonus aethiopoides]|nr:hypothetical protein PV325_004813 [Microctonus aethiopoides]
MEVVFIEKRYMMNTNLKKKYTIAQFEDGLQIIPTCWLNEKKDGSWWPSHIKSLNTLEKLIKAANLPEDVENWNLCKVERCFGSTDDWFRAKEKLVEAEETSCLIESDELSDNELAMKLKKQRRKRAKKTISSDESSSEPTNDRNLPRKHKITITKNKSADNLMLPTPPLFYSSTPARTSIQDEINTHPSTSKRTQFHEKTITHGSTGGNVATTSIGGNSEVNHDISESGK